MCLPEGVIRAEDVVTGEVFPVSDGKVSPSVGAEDAFVLLLS
jgi:hypothetical protein